jgi:hypothetical protein
VTWFQPGNPTVWASVSSRAVGVYFDTLDLAAEAKLGLYTPHVENGATGTCPNPSPPLTAEAVLKRRVRTAQQPPAR